MEFRVKPERKDDPLVVSGVALPNMVAGRLAGILYVAGGLISLSRLVLAAPDQYNRVGVMAVSAAAIATGLVALRAPWDRWPRQATLVLVPIAFTLIGVVNAFGTDPFSFGIFFVMAFVWIGVAHPRWTSLKFAPLATVAYLASLMAGPFRALGPSSTILTIPACVVIGETLAWLGARTQLYARALLEEREVTERLRSLDEMKNSFLNAVSHELRTPLTSVLGLAETLQLNRGQVTPEEHDELLARLTANAEKLDHLLSDLLDLDRLNRGVMEPRYQHVRLDVLAAEVVQSMDHDGRTISVETEPVEISVDPPKVERIIENLVANSLRHTPVTAPVWVRVGAHGDGVLISVEDGGPGVPSEVRETIFQPFQRGQPPDPARPGTGIGLSLVRRFAELHGGSAWVTDSPSGGASFRVFLPHAGEAPPRGGGAGTLASAV